MKSFIPLAAFSLLSTTLAVVHNKSVSNKQPSPVMQPVMAALAPGQRVASNLRQSAERMVQNRSTSPQLEEENRKLKAQLAKTNASAKNLEQQNQRLSKLLQLQKDLRIAVSGSVAARVIGEGGTAWSRSATLDRGLRDGVKPKDIVVTDLGVVGQITSAIGPASSVVLFLTDPSSSVGVRIARSRITGVARGEGGETLSLTYIDKDADVKKGDSVFTSGMGGVFPPHLYIGKVEDVRTNISGTGRTARIRPDVNFKVIEEALILRKSQQAETLFTLPEPE